MVDPAEVEEIAERMADVIRQGRLGATSIYGLRSALDAMELEGVAGVLSMTVPARPKDRPDVFFYLGSSDPSRAPGPPRGW